MHWWIGARGHEIGSAIRIASQSVTQPDALRTSHPRDLTDVSAFDERGVAYR